MSNLLRWKGKGNIFFVKFCTSVIFAILLPQHGAGPEPEPSHSCQIGIAALPCQAAESPVSPPAVPAQPCPQTHQGPPRRALPPRWLLLTQPFPCTSICHCSIASQLTPSCWWGWSILSHNFIDLLVKYLLWVAAESSLSTKGFALANFLSVCKILQKREVYLCKDGNGLHGLWNVYIRDFTSPDLRLIG